MQEHSIDPHLLHPDKLVLELLLRDIQPPAKYDPTDAKSLDASGRADPKERDNVISVLEGLNDENDSHFQPTVFTRWDQEDLDRLPKPINKYLLQPYILWARGVVRRQTDVVFLTHIIIYLTTSVPSAIILYSHFSWLHAICHWLMQGLYCGPFTLMLHNHIHNNGVLLAKYSFYDKAFPYIIGPLMGHTWHSYFYHHVKCHHVEGNGPKDVSSTLLYQRDSLVDFSKYLGRFIFFTWIELPFYFVSKNKTRLAFESFSWELASYLFIYILAKLNFYPTLFVLIIPLVQMRIGMMVGNWAQHALVDETDPNSDYRSSITLIDVASNRYCFNDGWHTAHHLNPLRHWRDQPLSYLKGKESYDEGHALVFHDIDYIMLFVKLMRKDYEHLVKCLIPTGGDIGKSNSELEEMLRKKTRRFTEDEIEKLFPKRRSQ